LPHPSSFIRLSGTEAAPSATISSAWPLQRSASRHRHLGHAFLNTPQAFIDAGPESADPPLCFNREGSVCNKNQQTEAAATEKELDFRMEKLKGAEKEPWFWPAVKEVNAAAAAEKANVEAKVRDYTQSREAFVKAFQKYQNEAQVWTSTLRGAEDDYALYCRPFHDVTMKCERSWRKILRLWFAREPLPECAVGVTVPYTKNPTGKGILSYILGA